MEIKILGTGCSKCKKLEESTKKAVKELNIQANIEKEEDITKIMNYHVMRTPALVVDGKVVSQGRALTVKEIKKAIIPFHPISF
ncbi:MAG: thioredoxin family protein [Bacteroidales bacterium]